MIAGSLASSSCDDSSVVSTNLRSRSLLECMRANRSDLVSKLVHTWWMYRQCYQLADPNKHTTHDQHKAACLLIICKAQRSKWKSKFGIHWHGRLNATIGSQIYPLCQAYIVEASQGAFIIACDQVLDVWCAPSMVSSWSEMVNASKAPSLGEDVQVSLVRCLVKVPSGRWSPCSCYVQACVLPSEAGEPGACF
jgi:hypothetical protein